MDREYPVRPKAQRKEGCQGAQKEKRGGVRERASSITEIDETQVGGDLNTQGDFDNRHGGRKKVGQSFIPEIPKKQVCAQR